MKRKALSRKGFTLTETLIVVVILALMSSAGAVGVSAVMATHVTMIQVADAEILGSTAFQTIANELRFGQNIRVDSDGEYVVLDSPKYGPDTLIVLDEDGKLKYGKDDPDHGLSDLLGESAYSGLDISALEFDRDGNGAITISLAVSGNKGDLWSGDLTVAPLN